jgi:hypothetical protein
MSTHIARAGRYVKQATGYRAFVPSPLPPDPPLAMDDESIALLTSAAEAIGRLAGRRNDRDGCLTDTQSESERRAALLRS